MTTHVVGAGGVDLLLQEGPFGDVRDVLTTSRHWGDPGHGYATSDIFVVRHQLICELDPQPTSVFEFGALVGYFLMTAVDAAPSINRIGWVDNELDCPGSNQIVIDNLNDYFGKHNRGADLWYDTATRKCVNFQHADLVQVDAAHSYPDCLTDLVWALELRPQVILVDDYAAISDVKRATDDFARWRRLEVEYHETVNGLAVLRFP